MADGTVLIIRTSRAARRVGNSRAFFAKIAFPPFASVTNSSNIERSKQMDVENNTPANSSAVKICLAHIANATALQCLIATPLGCPVDPEVYKTYAKQFWLVFNSDPHL